MKLIKGITGIALLTALSTGCFTTVANDGEQAAKSGTKQAQTDHSLQKPGFKVEVVDGRLLVFAEGSEALAKYEETGKEPAKIVVRPLAGPNKMTIMAPEAATIDAYMLSKPGFKVEVVDGRLLVFAEGSEALAKYEETGKEPAKIVVRPLAGPNRMTIMSPDGDAIDAYMGK